MGSASEHYYCCSPLRRALTLSIVAALGWTVVQLLRSPLRTADVRLAHSHIGLRSGALLTPTAEPAAAGPSTSQQQRPSEWDNHIIFDGEGWLSTCPTNIEDTINSSSTGWPQGSWLQPAVSSSSSSSSSSSATGRGLMLPHSALVQRKIWENQHPPDCKKAQFLLYRDPTPEDTGHGIGSVLHMQTVALMYALNTGRVLVTLPGSYLTADPYCGANETLDSCYFQPLTHCKVTQQQAESAWMVAEASKQELIKFRSGPSEDAPQFVSLAGFDVMKQPFAQTAPKPFQGLLNSTDIPRKNQYYWWRAQGIAYIVRPNQRTLQELAKRQRDKLLGAPLAPGCVTVYVRHGDKHREAKVYEDVDYEDALHHLRRLDPSLTRQVVLSTEDPATVEYFTNSRHGWSTTYVDMPRKPNRKKSNVAYMKEHGFANEMLDGLLNLDLALQCDGFVSGVSSNWARLIDELRSTVRCKGQSLYMDVEYRSTRGLKFRS